MVRLEDLLGPLHQGVWEVIVPKEEVDEPLGPEWIISKVNLPSPQTIASYRNGRYHCHETKLEWRVHLDLYDPSSHPIMHLVDDAPLVLMLAGTFESLWVDAKNTRRMDVEELLREHKSAWQLLLVIGIFFLGIGALVLVNSWLAMAFFVVVGLPAAIIGFALFLFYLGYRTKPFNAIAKRNIIVGIAFIVIGLLALLSPVFLTLLLVMFVAIWPISTAFVSLRRTTRGKIATPDGFLKRLSIGLLSAVLVILFLIWPLEVTAFIIDVVAIMVILIGILYLFRAFGVRSALKALHIDGSIKEANPEGG
ncbi:MAG: hypothetical protein SA339_06720 [Methanomassiliicoccus sp.]|nr:hypothetical protein [Methanomassiliicoccus sp.]